MSDLPVHHDGPEPPPAANADAQLPPGETPAAERQPVETPAGTLPFVPRVTPIPASQELEADVLPFRRKGEVKRRKKSLAARLLKPLAIACFIVGLPVVVGVWLLNAPQFGLRNVGFGVESEHQRVPKAWVEQTLASFEGQNIWQLPLADVEQALHRHPWVESVGLRKAPPRTLVVSVVEKREVALFRRGASELFYVDGAGKVIDRFDYQPGKSDLPIFSGGDPAVLLPAAIGLLQEIEHAQPTWLAGLSEVEILGEQDYRLFTADLPFPLLVRAGTLNDKARRLQALLPQIVDRYPQVTAVDLRFARRIIVQPTDLDLTPAAKGPSAKAS